MTFDNFQSEPGLMNTIGDNVPIRNKLEKNNKALTSLLYKDQQSTKNRQRTQVNSQKRTSTNGFKHMT